MFEFIHHPDIYILKIKYIFKSNNPKKKVHEYILGYSTRQCEVAAFTKLETDILEKLVRNTLSIDRRDKSQFEFVKAEVEICNQVCVTDILRQIES